MSKTNHRQVFILQENLGSRWMGNDVEMQNGESSTCGELCTSFLSLSCSSLIISVRYRGSDGT